MNRFNDFQDLFVPFHRVLLLHHFLSVIVEVFLVFVEYALCCQLQEGYFGGVFDLFSLLNEGPLLGPNLSGNFLYIQGQFHAYILTRFLVGFGLRLRLVPYLF